MQRTRIVGIDPGLVHTGVVEFTFIPDERLVFVKPTVVPGTSAQAAIDAVVPIGSLLTDVAGAVFIEAYTPRSHFESDGRMVVLVKDIHRYIPKSEVIPNTGVKKVITPALLGALNCWTFSTKTHHQDLRSAALIGLYGMVKHPNFNQVLAEFLRDHIDGNPWKVEVVT